MPRQTTKRPPPPKASGTRYEDDYYTWIQEQVALLRAGRLDEVDAANVAEELSDMGKSEFRSLVSAIAVLTMHLLKWDHQPERRSRSWAITVRNQRRHILEDLGDSPGLKGRLDEAIVRGYADGRDRAIEETGVADDVFPEVCPYTFDEMMAREIVFQG
jgi:hypothetical protein